MSDVIRAAGYSEIDPTRQINSRNLNQAIKFTTVLSSPLIKFFIGKSLGFDSFESILHQNIEGELLNAMEKKDFSPLEKYQLVKKSIAPIGDYVKRASDTAPAFAVTLATNLTASATDAVISVVANGEYLLQEGTRIYNTSTKETMIVLETATGNTNIPVQRGANGSTVAAMTTSDPLVITGTVLDMYTPQSVITRPMTKRGTTLYNGFKRLFTAGIPLTNTLKEETLLYDGRFKDLLKQDLQRAHKSMLLNSLLFDYYGDISSSDTSDPLSNINRFNGYAYWADQNANTAGFTDIGSMTDAKFEALMSWFEDYDGIGSSNAPMVYICGPTAYKAIHPFLQKGVTVNTDKGFIPSTVGGRVERYITNTGRQVYVCMDSYLNQVGCGGHIIMCAENNMNLYIGEDEFLTPENSAIGTRGVLPGEPRFIQLIEDYIARSNVRADVLISQYSMLPDYTELCSMATGITG